VETRVAAPTSDRRRWLTFAVGVGVSGGCLGGILAQLDFHQIRHAFTTAEYHTLPVMVLVVSALLALNSWRWTWMLRPLGRYRVRETFPPLMIGLAMNNVLPARLGEFIRVDAFCRRHKAPRAAVLAGVALERVFDVAAVMVFLAIGLISLPGADARVQQAALWLGGLAVVAFAAAGAFVVWTPQVSRLMQSLLSRSPLPAAASAWAERILQQGADGLGIIRHPRLLASCLVNTLAQWALAGLQMTLALRAFDVEIAPATACLLASVVAIGVTVPSAPGFLGVIQALFLLVVNERTVGPVDSAAVFAASVYYHMTQYLLVTATGLLLFTRASLTGATAAASPDESADLATSSPRDADARDAEQCDVAAQRPHLTSTHRRAA
jgi:uncharacterized protein (TIRG00374 family)